MTTKTCLSVFLHLAFFRMRKLPRPRTQLAVAHVRIPPKVEVRRSHQSWTCVRSLSPVAAPYFVQSRMPCQSRRLIKLRKIIQIPKLPRVCHHIVKLRMPSAAGMRWRWWRRRRRCGRSRFLSHTARGNLRDVVVAAIVAVMQPALGWIVPSWLGK